MNLKEEILYNFNGLDGIDDRDEKRFNSFLKAYNEDVKEFGKEKTVELYSMIFGEELKEDFESLNEINLESLPSEAKDVLSFRNKAAPGAMRLTMPGRSIGALSKEQAIKLSQEAAKNKWAIPGYTPNKAIGLWQKIKNFFAGSFTSIKEIIKTGSWSKLFALPIFKGALVAGGVVALIAILKKIFGKKKIAAQEAQIRAQAAQAGYKK